MFNFFGSDGSVIQSDRACKCKHCDATRALTILESGKAGHLASQQAGRSGKNPANRFDWLTDASAKTTPPSVSHAFPRQLTDGAVGTRRNVSVNPLGLCRHNQPFKCVCVCVFWALNKHETLQQLCLVDCSGVTLWIDLNRHRDHTGTLPRSRSMPGAHRSVSNV